MDPETPDILDSYRLISGAVVDLREVGMPARLFVNDLALRLSQGQGYDELIGRILRHDAVIYEGMSPLTPGAAELPAVKVARDLVYRAGVAEGAIKGRSGEGPAEALPTTIRTALPTRAAEIEAGRVGLTTEQIVTVGEAMNILGITRQAVINAVRSNRVRGEQHGKLWILSREDVLQYRNLRDERRARSRGG